MNKAIVPFTEACDLQDDQRCHGASPSKLTLTTNGIPFEIQQVVHIEHVSQTETETVIPCISHKPTMSKVELVNIP